MEGKDVGEVVQVNGPEQANQKLADGWELLAIVPTLNNVGKAYVAYVLGKPRERQASPAQHRREPLNAAQTEVRSGFE